VLGTSTRPWEDVFFRDKLGAPKSIRDIDAGEGLPDQPFIVDAAGDVVMDPDRMVGQGSNPPVPHDYPGYMEQSYVGDSVPGAGPNTLENGYSRIWMDLNGAVHLVTRVANRYFQVELTEDEEI
jgi:hypothetical protein